MTHGRKRGKVGQIDDQPYFVGLSERAGNFPKARGGLAIFGCDKARVVPSAYRLDSERSLNTAPVKSASTGVYSVQIRKNRMNRQIALATFVLLGSAAYGYWQHQARAHDLGWDAEKTQYELYNGWFLSPAGDRTTLSGDTPGSIVFSNDGKYALVNTCGYNDHTLNVVDWQTGKVVDSQKVARSSFGIAVAGNMVFTSGGASGGKAEYPDIHTWTLSDGKLSDAGRITLDSIPAKDRFVTALLPADQGMYVANAQSDEILLIDNQGTVLRHVKVGYRPRMMALSPDRSTLAVTEWGDQGVVLLDSQTLATKERFATLPHPTCLVYHPDGRLFVSESGSNTIIQIENHQVTRITASMDTIHPVGPTPNGLALSKDGNQLFVTLSGENAVAVIDVHGGRPSLKGHIPTERYPSLVAVSPDGKKLLIGTAKGLYGPSSAGGKEIHGASSSKQQMTARVAILDIPDDAKLRDYSSKAVRDFPVGVNATALTSGEVRLATSHLKEIKHVIYVIKENKTYDQVLGDLSYANGDPSTTLFGEKVTPNIHELARKFMTFDNLYCDGEASQVGHQWTDAGYASEYTESQWTSNYGEHGELESDKRLTSSPGEYLWSNARKKGLWARVYGEYVDVQEDHGSLDDPDIKANPERWGYSEPWERVFARGGSDTEKLDTFLPELKRFESTGHMPALMVMAMPDDHTHGYDSKWPTPKAMIGSNDLAVGRLVEAISHSKFWADTAIFVIQDDTQGGLDHVDSHRTYGLVLSPFTRKGAVDSTHYSTASMLLTMETILGLPPMSSYDAHATPMLRPFLGGRDLTPFSAVEPGVDIKEMNKPKTPLAARTARLDFTDIDRVDPETFSRLLWDGEKPGVPYPGSRPH